MNIVHSAETGRNKCDICEKRYLTNNTMVNVLRISFIYRLSSFDDLNNHLQTVHNIDVVITKHTFGSFHHFLEWKEEEENLTDSWYVLHSAPNIRDGN